MRYLSSAFCGTHFRREYFTSSSMCISSPCVVLNGCYYDYSEIEFGIPQCFVLGRLIFLIYINYYERNVKSNIKFFADNTMLLCYNI